jgi:hypothetical protein
MDQAMFLVEQFSTHTDQPLLLLLYQPRLRYAQPGARAHSRGIGMAAIIVSLAWNALVCAHSVVPSSDPSEPE